MPPDVLRLHVRHSTLRHCPALVLQTPGTRRPCSQVLCLRDNYLTECPAWLPAACPRLRCLDLGFNGQERGSYEDPHPLTLTPAVLQLTTR